MAYNLIDLTTEVQRYVRDDAFPTVQIREYINAMQRFVLGKFDTPFTQREFSATLTQGVHTYETEDGTIPQYQSMLSLTIIDPDDGKKSYDVTDYYMNFRQFERKHPNPLAYNEQKPREWTIYRRDNQIFFSAPVDKNYIMKARYYATPTELVNDTDVPELPEEYREILILGAAAKVHQVKDNYDIAQILRNEAEEIMDDMLLRYSPRQHGTSDMADTNRIRVEW